MKVRSNEPRQFGIQLLNALYIKTIGSHSAIASWFPIRRRAVAMVADCRLLLVLWSDNGNEHCQLQVHFFSVIHLVHLFITKVGGNIVAAIRGLSKWNIMEQNGTKWNILGAKKLTIVSSF
jgi:hypothetical protein